MRDNRVPSIRAAGRVSQLLKRFRGTGLSNYSIAILWEIKRHDSSWSRAYSTELRDASLHRVRSVTSRSSEDGAIYFSREQDTRKRPSKPSNAERSTPPLIQCCSMVACPLSTTWAF